MDDATRDVCRIGLLEGLSFLVLLFIAMPLKYLAGMPIAVRIAGSIHGVLFIAFVRAVVRARSRCGWPSQRVAAALAASVIPFGPLVLDRKLRAERADVKTS